MLTKHGERLYAALRTRRAIAPLTATLSQLTVDEAYQISLSFLDCRVKDGERIVGKKIGVTSKPVQDMLDVREPDFGFLTDVMHIPDGGTIEIGKSLIQPRAEAEIAFLLRKELHGPGVTMGDV